MEKEFAHEVYIMRLLRKSVTIILEKMKGMHASLPLLGGCFIS
jgi:hypothetical protein